MIYFGDVPEEPDEFHRVMVTIDNELKAEGVKIDARPLHAIRKVSLKYSISLPMTEPIKETPGIEAAWPAAERVNQWYKDQYGERLTVDFSPGRMAILIEEDLWGLKVPKIYGTANLTVSRTIKSDTEPSSHGPVTLNIMDQVEGLTSSRLMSLPDKELEHVHEKFLLAMQAFSLFEGSSENHLVQSARTDIATSAQRLLDPNADYGLSKWSSLQAAEKTMKAAIQLAGGTYSRTHILETLNKEVRGFGVYSQDVDTVIPYIQCSPSIRYGAEACDRDDAVLAHQCALAMIIGLRNGGAQFAPNMSIQYQDR